MELADNLKWLWILSGGCTPLEKIRRSPRIIAPTSIFTPGESVRPGFDRHDNVSTSYAYYEFKEIESALDKNSIIAYTDGSFKDGISGSGAAIYHNNMRIREISSPNGHTSIIYAELFAILLVLRWIKHSNNFCNGSDVHFFQKYFFLFQEIKHLH